MEYPSLPSSTFRGKTKNDEHSFKNEKWLVRRESNFHLKTRQFGRLSGIGWLKKVMSHSGPLLSWVSWDLSWMIMESNQGFQCSTTSSRFTQLQLPPKTLSFLPFLPRLLTKPTNQGSSQPTNQPFIQFPYIISHAALFSIVLTSVQLHT